jgi:MerR family transcriptional regulator, light-induced transcriptional regulator
MMEPMPSNGETVQSVTTGEAARRLSVAPATVQRWVDSGVLHADRTVGGHRRISVAELRRLIALSRPPELAKPLTTWLDCLMTGDPVQVRSMMLAARRKAQSWAEASEEIASVIVELGRVWESGECAVFEEHMASEALHRAAASCAADMPARRNATSALLMSMGGERHTLGLSLAELVLAEAGWRVIWIGEGPPVHEIGLMVQTLKPDLCVVSASSQIKRRDVKSFQEALFRALRGERIRIVLAGSAPWSRMRGIHQALSFLDFQEYLDRVGRIVGRATNQR